MPTNDDDIRFAVIRSIGGERYKSFLDAGYKEWYQNNPYNHSPYLLQKGVYRDGIRLFFVNVWCYDLSGHCKDHPFAIQPECQFNVHVDQPRTFSVTLWPEEMTPTQIEEWFLAVYDRMECQPYDD